MQSAFLQVGDELRALTDLLGAPPQRRRPTTREPARRPWPTPCAGPDLALADALATAVAVGGDRALPAVERLGGYEAWLIRPDGSSASTAGWQFAPARAAA